MSYFQRQLFRVTAVIMASGFVAPLGLHAQTKISAPTAITQIYDFRVADGTWEDFDQTFIDGAGVEQTVNAGPELEVIDITTRPVSDQSGSGTALDGITGTFKGLSQNADGDLRGHNRTNPRRGEDFVVETFFNATTIRQFSRYNQSDTSIGGNRRAGTLQWGFDLTPLDTYLSTEGLVLDDLEVNLRANWQALQGRDYELLLSYTNASEGITLGEISTEVGTEVGSSPGSETNWQVLFKPSRDGAEGDIIGDDPRTGFTGAGDYNIDDAVNGTDFLNFQQAFGDAVSPGTGADGDSSGTVDAGDLPVWAENYGTTSADMIVEPNTHKVVATCVRCDADEFTADAHITTIDILDLYNQGVREFNLVALASGFGDIRNFAIFGPVAGGGGFANDLSDPLTFGSGVYINTSPAPIGAQTIPEPGGLTLLLLSAMGFGVYRRKFAVVTNATC